MYEELRAVLHPVSRDGVTTTDFGPRGFAALDGDGTAGPGTEQVFGNLT